MPIPEKREIESRTRAKAAARLRKDLASAHQLAQGVSRVMAAREAHKPIAARLRKLRRAHAILIGEVTGRESNVVPGGVDVPGHDFLVRKIRATTPWMPPADAYVRGARDGDPIEVIRVLLALETGLDRTPACRLAAAAEALPDHEKAKAILRPSVGQLELNVDRTLKRFNRSGAYERWKADVRCRLQISSRVARESVDSYEERMARLRQLAEVHGLIT